MLLGRCAAIRGACRNLILTSHMHFGSDGNGGNSEDEGNREGNGDDRVMARAMATEMAMAIYVLSKEISTLLQTMVSRVARLTVGPSHKSRSGGRSRSGNGDCHSYIGKREISTLLQTMVRRRVAKL